MIRTHVRFSVEANIKSFGFDADFIFPCLHLYYVRVKPVSLVSDKILIDDESVPTPLGRTGRAGRRGKSITFFTENDKPLLRRYDCDDKWCSRLHSKLFTGCLNANKCHIPPLASLTLSNKPDVQFRTTWLPSSGYTGTNDTLLVVFLILHIHSLSNFIHSFF